jgi:glyoxylase-like metal-dependent hydrolase (beta-lactamase superfamily II)
VDIIGPPVLAALPPINRTDIRWFADSAVCGSAEGERAFARPTRFPSVVGMDVVELAPGLHWFRCPVGHAYLWRGDDGLTLIDSGVPGSGAAIAEAISGLGHQTSDVRRLFLTHFHEDHVGGAAEVVTWGDVTVYAGRTDAPYIRGEAAGPPAVLLDWERDLLERVRSGMSSEPAAPVKVDRELDGGETLESGQALAVPGHTPGSMALYLPEQRILFTGDTIARSPDGTVMLGVFNVDRPKAIDSFRRQTELEIDIACFGHGDPIVGNAGTELRKAAPSR